MAAIPTTAPLLTADDLLAMPDDGHRYELSQGKLVRLPISSNESSDIAGGILFALRGYAYPRQLGWVTGDDGAYILRRNPYTVRIPDVAFVLTDRMPPQEQRRCYLELAPDIVVEVVSPSDNQKDVQAKVHEYISFGVRLVWVVYPVQRTVAIHTADRPEHFLHEEDTLDGGDVLPGFTLSVADIFA